MPTTRRRLPVALKAFAAALVVLVVVGALITASGFANLVLADVIRGGSLALVGLVCLVIVLVRGTRRR